jgi:hypothetical protein
MSVNEKLYEIEACLTKARKVLKEVYDEIKSIQPIEKEYINIEEYNGLIWELEGWPDIVKAIYKSYDITSLKNLLRTDLPLVKVKIKDIKKTYDNYVSE